MKVYPNTNAGASIQCCKERKGKNERCKDEKKREETTSIYKYYNYLQKLLFLLV